MQFIYFALAAAALYVLSDWALRGLESALGRRFEQRSLIFFGILLISTIIVFSAIRGFVAE